MARILLEAFQRCDTFAQLVLLFLAILSIVSWAILLGEALGMRRASRAATAFLQGFEGLANPLELYSAGLTDERMAGPLWRVYVAGCQRLRALLRDPQGSPRKQLSPKDLMDVEDAMALAISQESLQVEMRLQVLGTISSVSPLMGLFGTVWGIMVCFHDMGVQSTTSLRAVTPGLTVALITTVIGLAVAIPALIGHNFLASQLRLSLSRMKAFALEFLCALEGRSGATRAEGTRP